MADSCQGRAHSLPASGIGFLVPAVVWAVWFAVIYSLQGAGCAAGLHGIELAGVDLLRGLLGILLLLALGGIGWFGLSSRRTLRRLPGAGKTADSPPRFLVTLALLSAVLFFIATVWVGLPVVVTDPCAGRLTGP